MKSPFVGLEQLGVGCGYSVDLDAEQCASEPAVHLLVDSPWGVVGLASCEAHALIARAAAREVLAEHPHLKDCGAVCWGAVDA